MFSYPIPWYISHVVCLVDHHNTQTSRSGLPHLRIHFLWGFDRHQRDYFCSILTAGTRGVLQLSFRRLFELALVFLRGWTLYGYSPVWLGCPMGCEIAWALKPDCNSKDLVFTFLCVHDEYGACWIVAMLTRSCNALIWQAYVTRTILLHVQTKHTNEAWTRVMTRQDNRSCEWLGACQAQRW